MVARSIMFLVFALLMLLPLPFCAFGFIASFELSKVNMWHFVYAGGAIILLALFFLFLTLAFRGMGRSDQDRS